MINNRIKIQSVKIVKLNINLNHAIRVENKSKIIIKLIKQCLQTKMNKKNTIKFMTKQTIIICLMIKIIIKTRNLLKIFAMRKTIYNKKT